MNKSGSVVYWFEDVYLEEIMVETGTDKVQDLAKGLQKAGLKQMAQTSENSDVVLKYEGKSPKWNGIIYEASTNASLWLHIRLSRTSFKG